VPAPHRPEWLLPAGVTRGLWDYVQAEHIAWDYDEYHAFNSLFEFDQAVLAEHFRPPGLVVDLGCGSGRALVPLVRSGLTGLAVDLSAEMLAVVGEKAETEGLPIHRILANVAELDAVRDHAAEYAMCMYSTLGMIRGRENRQRALGHVRRILKPGGLFVLHVHNVWRNLHDSLGRRWVATHLARLALGRDQELGDKFFDYRGIPQMFLHVFTASELRAAIESAGFRVVRWIPLDTVRRHPLRAPWLASRIRANGWIVVAQTPAAPL
jgi:ubiquinone/menaquinone biosynthesis C-methylase UbiE